MHRTALPSADPWLAPKRRRLPSLRMPDGFLMMVLHAHLPFVRHPEDEHFLEEHWLFEAITETYIPLLNRLEHLVRDGVRTRLTMTWSPPLCEMLSDPMLAARYRDHVGQLLALSEQEVHAKAHSPFAEAALMYRDHLRYCLSVCARFDGNLVRWVRELRDAGVLEPITCGATHGFLPLMLTSEAQRAQIRIACEQLPQAFRLRPARHMAARMRLHPGHRAPAQGCRHPLLLRRHPRHLLRRPAAALRRLRPGLHPVRYRRLRPRPRILALGVVGAVRLPRRSALPRVLPRSRLRRRLQLRARLPPPRRRQAQPRPQVPCHHRQGRAPPQGPLPAGAGVPARDGAWRRFRQLPHRPMPPHRRAHRPAAAGGLALRRRALRPLVVRGHPVHREHLPRRRRGGGTA